VTQVTEVDCVEKNSLGSQIRVAALKEHVRFTPSGSPHKVMSALTPKADMATNLRDVRC
jgi:hypothetical protein